MFAKTKKAFTLVEVMIAVGILSVSITAIVALLSAIANKVAEVSAQSKAISLVEDLQIILRGKTFDSVYYWVRNPDRPYVIYFWDEYSNPDDADDPSLVTISSETTGKRSGMPPNEQDLRKAHGPIFRALLYLSADALKGRHTSLDDPATEYNGGSLPENPDKYGEAYLPIKVEFLIDPRDDIVIGFGNDDKNKQRRVHTDLTVKMR